MNEKELDIVSKVLSVFMRCGVKAISMDDMARELGMSKKTLYKFVKDKNDLVNKVMTFQCTTESCMVDDIALNTKNAIDEIIELSKHISQKLQSIHPSVHFDLNKYYPEAWKIFNEHRTNIILKFIENNLKRGIKENLYRDNFNPKVIARLYIHKIDALFNPDIFPPGEISFVEAYNEMMKYHIRGVANEKGVKYMKNKLKKETLNIF
ncbi:MAG: TetR/AcrR family transcriptional regulator [Bacteroidia bacterium]